MQLYTLFAQSVAGLADRASEVLSSKEGVASAVGVPSSTREEWHEFFSEGVFSVALAAFVDAANDAVKKDLEGQDVGEIYPTFFVLWEKAI